MSQLKKQKHKNNIARTITNDKGFPYLNTRENNEPANRIGIAQEAQTSKQTNKKAGIQEYYEIVLLFQINVFYFDIFMILQKSCRFEETFLIIINVENGSIFVGCFFFQDSLMNRKFKRTDSFGTECVCNITNVLLSLLIYCPR